jgi:hypothetical protein
VLAAETATEATTVTETAAAQGNSVGEIILVLVVFTITAAATAGIVIAKKWKTIKKEQKK